MLQGFAAFRLAPSRITPRHSQTRRDTNFAIPGYSLFCHDTTASGKNKVFSVCGHSCGQNRFCAVFGNRGKTAIARVARLSGLLSKPLMDRVYALPNHVRYQLRHTRIFNFCHDTTAGKKIKDFSVCGHSCGQSRFQQPEKILPSPVLQGFPAFRLAPSRIPPRHSQAKRDADSLFLDGEYYYSRSKHACPAPFSAFSAYGRVS